MLKQNLRLRQLDIITNLDLQRKKIKEKLHVKESTEERITQKLHVKESTEERITQKQERKEETLT